MSIDPPHGFTVERLGAEQNILAYRFYDLLRTTVDSWTESIHVEYGAWEHDQLRTMLDLRPAGGIIMPYVINAARPLAQLRPELRGRLAILINGRISAQIMSAAIRANFNVRRRRLIFVDDASAIAWLLIKD